MRMMFRRYPILILFAVALLNAPVWVNAQSPVQIERLQVDLWPEFDRPDMLVIHRGTLPANVPLPAIVTLRVPARVGEPHAVAYADESGELFDAPFSTTSDGDWLRVTLEVATPRFQVEYYDTLTSESERRSYTYTWAGGNAVGEFAVLLLPPPSATDIQSTPSLSAVEQASGSITYVGSLGNLAPGQESQVTVSYRGATRSSSEGAVLPATGNGSGTLFVAGLGAGALALVIGGVIWYTRRAKPTPTPKAAKRRMRSDKARGKSRKQKARARPSTAGFCTRCGRPLKAKDRFCGECGAAVKYSLTTQD